MPYILTLHTKTLCEITGFLYLDYFSHLSFQAIDLLIKAKVHCMYIFGTCMLV